MKAMRILIAFIAGVTLMILWHILGWPWIGWMFTRIEPEDPTDLVPKARTWIKGVLQP
ncbi:hypothetical protein [Microbacterium sp. CBA3102]|uniref:hypothetical protein n=1 Tax=Microbacterium sp. CBA3102 TaxID=2603598 RepID=UPI0018832F64|nr:hypothetical protein [Microbacterium sp. CBA3102]